MPKKDSALLESRAFRIAVCALMLVLAMSSAIDFSPETGFSKNACAPWLGAWCAFAFGTVILRWKSWLRPAAVILLTTQTAAICLDAGSARWGLLSGWLCAVLVWLLNRRLYPDKKNAFVEALK